MCLFLDTKQEILSIPTKSLVHSCFLFLISPGVIFPQFNSPLVCHAFRNIFKFFSRELIQYAMHITQALFWSSSIIYFVKARRFGNGQSYVFLCLKTEGEPASETSCFLNLGEGRSPKKEILSVGHTLS